MRNGRPRDRDTCNRSDPLRLDLFVLPIVASAPRGERGEGTTGPNAALCDCDAAVRVVFLGGRFQNGAKKGKTLVPRH